MKLYYSPFACSLASHIILEEIGVKYEAERVDLKSKQTASGADYAKISDKGYVPHLTLDSGEGISEGSVIMQYLADLHKRTDLAPANGTLERVRLQEWLNYIGTEAHKSIGGLFRAAQLGAEGVEFFKARANRALTYLESKIGENGYLMGKNFTIADAYLFVVLGWTKPLNFDMSPYPKLSAYQQRVGQLPAVQRAVDAEK